MRARVARAARRADSHAVPATRAALPGARLSGVRGADYAAEAGNDAHVVPGRFNPPAPPFSFRMVVARASTSPPTEASSGSVSSAGAWGLHQFTVTFPLRRRMRWRSLGGPGGSLVRSVSCHWLARSASSIPSCPSASKAECPPLVCNTPRGQDFRSSGDRSQPARRGGRSCCGARRGRPTPVLPATVPSILSQRYDSSFVVRSRVNRSIGDVGFP